MENNKLEKKLDTLIDLSRHAIAVILFRGGATQDDICKSLHLGKQTVVEMLKGVKKEK